MQTILDSFKSENHLLESNVYQYLLREKVEKILVACSGEPIQFYFIVIIRLSERARL